MQRWFSRTLTLALSLGLVFLFSGSALAQYTVTLLDSNVSGRGQLDPLLVNGWGLAYLPNEAFWVSDAGSGWSTLYDGSGNKQSLEVLIPAANGLYGGSPTGIVANSSNEFQVRNWASEFIFATLDGTISGLVADLEPYAGNHRGKQLQFGRQLYRSGHHQPDFRQHDLCRRHRQRQG